MCQSNRVESGRTTQPNAAIALWGALGVCAILVQAIVRLTPLALEPIRERALAPWQWGVWVAWVAFSMYSEGYKGFQKAFSPRVVARSVYLARHPRPLFVAFAPLYAMAFFHATRGRLIFSWAFTACLVLVIVIVQQVSQPWRGIIDAGVVLGLTWGIVAILVYLARALSGRPLPVSADVPDEPTRDTV